MYQIKTNIAPYIGNVTTYVGECKTLHANIQQTCKDLGYAFTSDLGSYTISKHLICDIYKNNDHTFTLDVRRISNDREVFRTTYNTFMFYLHAKGDMEEVKYMRNIYKLPPIYKNNL